MVAPIVTALGKATKGGKKLKEQSNERQEAGGQAIKPSKKLGQGRHAEGKIWYNVAIQKR